MSHSNYAWKKWQNEQPPEGAWCLVGWENCKVSQEWFAAYYQFWNGERLPIHFTLGKAYVFQDSQGERITPALFPPDYWAINYRNTPSVMPVELYGPGDLALDKIRRLQVTLDGVLRKVAQEDRTALRTVVDGSDIIDATAHPNFGINSLICSEGHDVQMMVNLCRTTSVSPHTRAYLLVKAEDKMNVIHSRMAGKNL